MFHAPNKTLATRKPAPVDSSKQGCSIVAHTAHRLEEYRIFRMPLLLHASDHQTRIDHVSISHKGKLDACCNYCSLYHLLSAGQFRSERGLVRHN